jgi:hypothetical protein
VYNYGFVAARRCSTHLPEKRNALLVNRAADTQLWKSYIYNGNGSIPQVHPRQLAG